MIEYIDYWIAFVIIDEPDTSSVSAYWEDTGVMSLSVNTTSELYVIEVSNYVWYRDFLFWIWYWSRAPIF
jgi:hypothetical protein